MLMVATGFPPCASGVPMGVPGCALGRVLREWASPAAGPQPARGAGAPPCVLAGSWRRGPGRVRTPPTRVGYRATAGRWRQRAPLRSGWAPRLRDLLHLAVIVSTLYPPETIAEAQF